MSAHRTFTFSKPWLSAPERFELAKRLRDAREARRMTKREFARQVGVTENTAWSWENGRTQPNPDKLPVIASVLGLSEAFLRLGTASNNDESEARVSDTIASDIERLRRKIASALGMPASQVRVSVELLSG
jgi:transcriptional regulator with XRE-family HTH domain